MICRMNKKNDQKKTPAASKAGDITVDSLNMRDKNINLLHMY